MHRSTLVACAAAAMVLAGCEDGGISVNPAIASASGQDNAGEVVSVTIRQRDDGARVALLSGGLDYTCTAVYEDPPAARSSELADIRCTDGSSGTATLRYDRTGAPQLFVYSLGATGAGTITF